MKYRSDLEDKASRLMSMESRLLDEKEEQKKQLDLLDQEVSTCCTGQPPRNSGGHAHIIICGPPLYNARC